MTYFAFLGLFLAIPIAVLLTYIGRKRSQALPDRLTAMRPAAAMAITALVAIAYTTPWDNYLVATGVWGYDRSLVSGVILGYVPLEEYLFFVLQTVLTSLALVVVARRVPRASTGAAGGLLRIGASIAALILWVVACAALAAPWGPSRYSALLFAWALPPILIQLAFGADLLWRERRTVVPTILLATLYYVVADIIAVSAGTWDFNLRLISGVRLGPLPVEEILFFLLTNVLVVFSVTLLLSAASMKRFHNLVRRARSVITRTNGGAR